MTKQYTPAKPANSTCGSLGHFIEKHTVILPVAGLMALCAMVYSPLRHAGFIWDDSAWILYNSCVHHWSGLRKIWFDLGANPQYYPLTLTGFLLQWKLWAANALAFHVVNIALQAGNAILLWRLLRSLRVGSAWAAAAIFAIHPMTVETVAWVVEQKNLVSGFFSLAAVFYWVRFAGLDRSEEAMSTGPDVYNSKFLTMGTLAYLLALLAKTFVCSLPAAILVLTWWKLGRLRSRHILSILPWFVLTAIAIPLARWRERVADGATINSLRFSIWQHVVIAGRDFWFYACKLVWPHPILTIYPRWHIGSPTTLDAFYPLSAAAFLVGLFLLRKRISRGPIAALAIYVILISPAMGFIPFGTMRFSFVSDYFAYLGCISLIVLFTEVGGVLLANHWARQPGGGAALSGNSGITEAVSTAVILLTLGILSFRQCEVYTPPWHIWTHTLRYNPTSFQAYDMLATYAYADRRYPQALALAQQAHRFGGQMDALSCLIAGRALQHTGQYAKAIPWYRKSLAIQPLHPRLIASLALCYDRSGNQQMAVRALHQGINRMPKASPLYLALGLIREERHDFVHAAMAFRTAIRWDHTSAPAWFDLAITEEKLGNKPAAIRAYKTAIALQPDLPKVGFLHEK